MVSCGRWTRTLQELAVFPALGKKQRNYTDSDPLVSFLSSHCWRYWKPSEPKVSVCMCRSPRLLPRELQDCHTSKGSLAKRPGHIPVNTQLQKAEHSQFCDWSFKYPWCGSRACGFIELCLHVTVYKGGIEEQDTAQLQCRMQRGVSHVNALLLWNVIYAIRAASQSSKPQLHQPRPIQPMSPFPLY